MHGSNFFYPTGPVRLFEAQTRPSQTNELKILTRSEFQARSYWARFQSIKLNNQTSPPSMSQLYVTSMSIKYVTIMSHVCQITVTILYYKNKTASSCLGDDAPYGFRCVVPSAASLAGV